MFTRGPEGTIITIKLEYYTYYIPLIGIWIKLSIYPTIDIYPLVI